MKQLDSCKAPATQKSVFENLEQHQQWLHQTILLPQVVQWFGQVFPLPKPSGDGFSLKFYSPPVHDNIKFAYSHPMIISDQPKKEMN